MQDSKVINEDTGMDVYCQDAIRQRMRRVCDLNVDTALSQKELTEWAPTYQQDMLMTKGYAAHKLTGAYVCELIDQQSRANAQVLDVGAGTGLVGDQLRKNGFTCIDAMEPNEALLTEAKKNATYRKYFLEYLTADRTSIADDKYDLVTGVGISRAFVVPYGPLKEMIRLLKPGGYIVITLLHGLLREYTHIQPEMDRLEDEGAWTAVDRQIVPNYYENWDTCNKDAIIWTYQKV